MVFRFFSRNVVPDEEEKKIWSNDANPSRETVKARFLVNKQIREKNVPELKPLPLTMDNPLEIASYKKGTTELIEKKIEKINSPSTTCARSASSLENGEVLVDDDDYDSLRPHGKNKKRRRKKRRRTNSET